MKAIVVGAGIGGLASAIALSREMDVVVLERADEIRPLGAGLSIWPNGVRALRELGLGPVIEAPDIVAGGGAIRRADGSVLAAFDPERIRKRWGEPLIGLHRETLHDALVGALGRSRIQLGRGVTDLTRDGVLLADGTEAKGDLIVGADGLWSALRASIIGDGEPIDAGLVALRGVSDWDGDVPAGEWWAERGVAGLLPLPDGKVYWYLAYRGEDEDAESLAGGFANPVAQIVAATPTSEVLTHRLYDRDFQSGWTQGNAVLLGDAAHPMLPFLGQGACSALEDAVALGKAIRSCETIDDGLSTYEKERSSVAAALVRASRQAAKIALAETPVTQRLRNLAIAKIPTALRLRQLDPFVASQHP